MLRFLERIRYRRMQQQNQITVLTAEMAIREIKRRAVRDLLDGSRNTISSPSGDVIDATAIEVRPADGEAHAVSTSRTHKRS
jgi:hypothetical protein